MEHPLQQGIRNFRKVVFSGTPCIFIMMVKVIQVSIDFLCLHTCRHRLSMLAYMFHVGIGDLCQHRFSLSAYVFNVDKGNLVSKGYPCWYTCLMLAWVINVSIDFICRHTCQHRLSMLAYIFNIGIDDLCQHRFLCLHTRSLMAKAIYVSIDFMRA